MFVVEAALKECVEGDMMGYWNETKQILCRTFYSGGKKRK
jgi:hypothetical protein